MRNGSVKGCIVLGALVLGGPLAGMLLAGWLTSSGAAAVLGFLSLPLSLVAGMAAWYAAAFGWLALRVAGRAIRRQPVAAIFEEPDQRREIPPLRWVLPLVIGLCAIPAGVLTWVFSPSVGIMTSLGAWGIAHALYGVAAYLGAPLYAADLERNPL